MWSAVETLALERLDVVYFGSDGFPLGEKVRAVGIGTPWSALEGDAGSG